MDIGKAKAEGADRHPVMSWSLVSYKNGFRRKFTVHTKLLVIGCWEGGNDPFFIARGVGWGGGVEGRETKFCWLVTSSLYFLENIEREL